MKKFFKKIVILLKGAVVFFISFILCFSIFLFIYYDDLMGDVKSLDFPDFLIQSVLIISPLYITIHYLVYKFHMMEVPKSRRAVERKRCIHDAIIVTIKLPFFILASPFLLIFVLLKLVPINFLLFLWFFGKSND